MSCNSVSKQASMQQYIREIRTRLQKLSKDPRSTPMYWEWLSDAGQRPLSKTEANNFLLGCILDVRASACDTWENCVFFLEEVLKNPEDIFAVIADYTQAEWEEEFDAYGLHPERSVHLRVHHIARGMMRLYRGDGRLLWELDPATPQEVYKRLVMLGFSTTAAAMVVGALKDENYLSGPFDLIPDAGVTRVVSRLLAQHETLLSADDVVRTGRYMYAPDPWALDRPLSSLARQTCKKKMECSICPMADICISVCEYPFSGDDLLVMIFGVVTHQMQISEWM